MGSYSMLLFTVVMTYILQKVKISITWKPKSLWGKRGTDNSTGGTWIAHSIILTNMFPLNTLGNKDITWVMLEAGAETDVVNSVGRTAAQMAAFVGELFYDSFTWGYSQTFLSGKNTTWPLKEQKVLCLFF